MKSDLQVAAPPPKPLLIYDGDCNFCKLWIRRWQKMSGDRVDYLPSQDPAIQLRFPEIPSERFDMSVQLITTNGDVYSGAEAVFRVLAENPGRDWPLRMYEGSPAIASITETAYRTVANHRQLFSTLTRWFWGRHVEVPEYFITRWVFLRALGIVYFFAFVSLWMQVIGLVGHDGILPVDHFLTEVQQQFHSQGITLDQYRQVPTLCWLDSSDRFLTGQCVIGIIVAVLLIIGIAPVPCLALLWLLYLSLVTAGQEFFGYQWDSLLLETGFLAIFFAPWQWLPSFRKEHPPSRLVLWLLRLLLFKLMFSSGCVKLLSQDPTWRDLTALTYHYQTQPLPTWLAWYATQLPLWFQKASCIILFAIELGAPWLIFGPRRVRFCGALAIACLQVLILLTGNYTFFNFLTISLCLLCLDDFVFSDRLPKLFHRFFQPKRAALSRRWRWPQIVIIPVAAVVVLISSYQIVSLIPANWSVFAPVVSLERVVGPFEIANNYGLFAVMTTTRNEIVVEGSNDGIHWLPYEFKYKPGDLNRRPAFVEPLQPRLDWQMWFAALGNANSNPWFEIFCVRLLQGSPPVLALLEKNPFPQHPPQFIRAQLYRYEFTTPSERKANGAWWKREQVGDYLPPVKLNP